MKSNALITVAALLLLQFSPQTAHAEYRILERTPSTHIVLTTTKCARTRTFIPEHNEKLGYMVEGEQRTAGCWYEAKGDVRFTFQASGLTLDYPVHKFRYIGPMAYDKKYGRI